MPAIHLTHVYKPLLSTPLHFRSAVENGAFSNYFALGYVDVEERDCM